MERRGRGRLVHELSPVALRLGWTQSQCQPRLNAARPLPVGVRVRAVSEALGLGPGPARRRLRLGRAVIIDSEAASRPSHESSPPESDRAVSPCQSLAARARQARRCSA